MIDGIDKKSINLLSKPPYRIKPIYDECFIIIRKKREIFRLAFNGEWRGNDLVWIKRPCGGSDANQRTLRVMVTNRGKVRKPRKIKNYHNERAMKRCGNLSWQFKKSQASLLKMYKRMVIY